MGLLLVIAGGARAAPDEELYPPSSVILLAASWCAPCRGEIATLDLIATAAAPRRIRVLVIDVGPRARAMTRDVPVAYRWTPEPISRERTVASLLGRTPGLPYAAATDMQGRLCAEHRGGLDDVRVRELTRRCGS